MSHDDGTTAPRRGRARTLLLDLCARTGLHTGVSPRRYLWTDAFAVCTLLGLGERETAMQLIEQVHAVLGRHREDDHRRGWISGLDEAEGRLHPTAGGLRIGKPLPERRADEPVDERSEWDRDGQYFHYLTKWMQALDQAARRTGEPRYARWAQELALVAHDAFVERDAGAMGASGRRMSWKRSIDLSRPLVPAMGLHDPLDGYLTCLQLAASASRAGAERPHGALVVAAADYAAMIPRDLVSADPLAIGGLLADASRLEQLAHARPGGADTWQRDLIERVLGSGLHGLARWVSSGELGLPPAQRLAFRELGLAIGLAGLPGLEARAGAVTGAFDLDALAALRRRIEEAWSSPSAQRTPGWREHRDINEAMLATSLAPAGYLELH